MSAAQGSITCIARNNGMRVLVCQPHLSQQIAGVKLQLAVGVAEVGHALLQLPSRAHTRADLMPALIQAELWDLVT